MARFHAASISVAKDVVETEGTFSTQVVVRRTVESG